MHGPLIDLLTAEHRSRHEGPVPPSHELVWHPWVHQFLYSLFGRTRITPASPPPAGTPPVPCLTGPADAPGVPGPGDVPATFLGWQDAWDGTPPYALWNLTAEVGGHPAGSTVATDTLTRAGYVVQEPPLPASEERLKR